MSFLKSRCMVHSELPEWNLMEMGYSYGDFLYSGRNAGICTLESYGLHSYKYSVRNESNGIYELVTKCMEQSPSSEDNRHSAS
jgi:hypothetical protein